MNLFVVFCILTMFASLSNGAESQEADNAFTGIYKSVLHTGIC